MALKLLIYMLIMVNPFSQVLYVWELMREMSFKEFVSVYWRATALSLGVFVLFALLGEWLFESVFQVRLEAFRIFGGLLILAVAYRYFTAGAGSNMLFRGKAEDLAPDISLPFMVGPGTLWVSILIGKSLPVLLGLGIIAAVIVGNFLFVIFIQRLVSDLEGYRETMVGKYFSVLMRTNALFVGAIAVEMIITGIEGAFESRALLP